MINGNINNRPTVVCRFTSSVSAELFWFTAEILG